MTARNWSVPKLAQRFNPFVNFVWYEIGKPLTKVGVSTAIAEGRLLTEACSKGLQEGRTWTRQMHIERVAWLVVNGWDDAIEVDVGIPNLGYVIEWWILDGNHRFAAAVYRGDTSILVSPSGQTDIFAEFELSDAQEPQTESRP